MFAYPNVTILKQQIHVNFWHEFSVTCKEVLVSYEKWSDSAQNLGYFKHIYVVLFCCHWRHRISSRKTRSASRSNIFPATYVRIYNLRISPLATFTARRIVCKRNMWCRCILSYNSVSVVCLTVSSFTVICCCIVCLSVCLTILIGE